jgi:hypothetical protein
VCCLWGPKIAYCASINVNVMLHVYSIRFEDEKKLVCVGVR